MALLINVLPTSSQKTKMMEVITRKMLGKTIECTLCGGKGKGVAVLKRAQQAHPQQHPQQHSTDNNGNTVQQPSSCDMCHGSGSLPSGLRSVTMKSLLHCIWRKSFERTLEETMSIKNILCLESHYDVAELHDHGTTTIVASSKAYIVCHGWADM